MSFFSNLIKPFFCCCSVNTHIPYRTIMVYLGKLHHICKYRSYSLYNYSMKSNIFDLLKYQDIAELFVKKNSTIELLPYLYDQIPAERSFFFFYFNPAIILLCNLSSSIISSQSAFNFDCCMLVEISIHI